MRSVKSLSWEMTMRSGFYSRRTISARLVLMKGSPPVMLVKYMRGEALDHVEGELLLRTAGSLERLHMVQRALQRYVTITVPLSFFSAMG